MTETDAVVWEGAEALRPFLVEVDSLEPFPGNPRRGDAAAVAESLRRFGQVRAILVDGSTIVAGHHLVEAATAEGWTHVAAIAHEFESEEERRAYLLADNRLSELGGPRPRASRRPTRRASGGRGAAARDGLFGRRL